MDVRQLVRSMFSQQRIAGGAFVLAVTQLLASVCGFFRDQAFSIMFPLEKDALGVASVYIAAFRPSDLLFQLLVMSCLSVILVPFLAGHLAHGRRDEMNRITSSVLIVFGLAFGAIALTMAVAFPWIAPHMTKFEGESLRLYIMYGRIALITNFLFVAGNTLGQYLIAVQRYWIYGITPILWALGTIIGTYFLTPIVGPLGPIFGTVAGTVVYVGIRLVGVMKAGFTFMTPSGGWVHRELREMGLLIIPRMMALGALQLQLLLLDRLASGLGSEMVAVNQFAFNFESVIPGIVGIAIAQSSFSLLSQAAARGDMHRFRTCLQKGILFDLSLAIPGAICMALLFQIPVYLLQLAPTVASTFVQSYLIYCIAVPFDSLNHLLLRSFYSMKNTLLPAMVSVLVFLSAIALGTYLVPSIGVYALAVAYTLAQVVETILLLALLLPKMRLSASGVRQSLA